MWLICSATPTFSTAATESPPPMMDVTPCFVRSARVWAIASVPAANLSNSNTPIGPFQITVLHSARACWNIFTESGPISKPIPSDGMFSTLTVWALASAANLSATTTSVGNSKSTPRSFALASKDLASSSLSSSTKDLPTFKPRAL